jgi:hypothetical protein
MRRRRHSDNVFVARRKTNEKRKDSDWWLSRGSAGVGTPSATVTAVAAAAAGPSLWLGCKFEPVACGDIGEEGAGHRIQQANSFWTILSWWWSLKSI